MGFSYIDHFDINETTEIQKTDSFESLSKTIQNCHLCDLSKSRKQSMIGYGNPHADLLIVDDFVSQSQDSANSYYAGRSGEILKKMIENVLELDIHDIYLTHTVKCKPLQSNIPSQSEWDSCKSYLFTQLQFIKPKIIVTLGVNAYINLTNDTIKNFEDVRGHVIDFKNYKLIPIYHPQFLLRNPELKKITFNDLNTIKSCL